MCEKVDEKVDLNVLSKYTQKGTETKKDRLRDGDSKIT